MNSTKTLSMWAGAFLLAVGMAPLAAQGKVQSVDVKGAGRWSELRLEVKDVSTGEIVGTVEPEGHIRMREGAKVRLIMSAFVPGNDKAIYPETTYTEAQKGRGGVQITKASRENANVTLQLVNIKGNYGQRSERISFEIHDERVPGRMQRGAFVIDVIGNAQADAETGGATAPGNTDSPVAVPDNRQGRVLRTLYRAILMREPDAGAQGFLDRIGRDGYPGAVQAAIAIADSNESRIQIYQRNPGLTPETRLLTLYKEILGMSDSQVDRRTWDDDLRQVRDGQISSVVQEMVRSARFRERYDSF